MWDNIQRTPTFIFFILSMWDNTHFHIPTRPLACGLLTRSSTCTKF